MKRSLTFGILGITLLLPATCFFLTLTARLCLGAKTPYYFFAPSFLQTPMNLFALHKAQVIIVCLLLAAALNARIKNWLSTAITLQATLLLIVLFTYTLIQHWRY